MATAAVGTSNGLGYTKPNEAAVEALAQAPKSKGADDLEIKIEFGYVLMLPSCRYRPQQLTMQWRPASHLLPEAQAYRLHPEDRTGRPPGRRPIPHCLDEGQPCQRARGDVHRRRGSVSSLVSAVVTDLQATRDSCAHQRRRLGARGGTRVRAEGPGRDRLHLNSPRWLSDHSTPADNSLLSCALALSVHARRRLDSLDCVTRIGLSHRGFRVSLFHCYRYPGSAPLILLYALTFGLTGYSI